MTPQPVLVLGGRGLVGRGASDWLTRQGMSVTSTSRSPRPVTESGHGPGVEAVWGLDVHDRPALDELLSQYRWVVHSAGPSAGIGATVAEVARRHRCRLFDVSGGSAYVETLREAVPPSAVGQYVHSAGVYPGITEVFGGHVAASLDCCHHLEVFLAGNGGFSVTGSRDLIESMVTGDVTAMAQVREGKVAPLTGGRSRVRLPAPAGAVHCMAVAGRGVQQLSARHHIETATFYTTYSHAQAPARLVQLRVEAAAADEAGRERLAASVAKELGGVTGTDAFTMVFVVATGTREATPARATGALVLDTDWNTASGWVAAAAVVAASQQSSWSPGLVELSDAVPASALIRALLADRRCRQRIKLEAAGQ